MDLSKCKASFVRKPRPKTDAERRERKRLANLKHKEKYNLDQYSLVMDKEVKTRFMDYCLKENLSGARIIQHLIVEFLDKQTPNG